MTTMRTVPLLLGLLCGVVLPACIGDLSQNVRIVNGTTYTVTVYPYGRNQSQFKHVLAASASADENMLTSDTNSATFVARVEAVDLSGSLVFCRRYTYGELKQLGWQIQIKDRELQC